MVVTLNDSGQEAPDSPLDRILAESRRARGTTAKAHPGMVASLDLLVANSVRILHRVLAYQSTMLTPTFYIAAPLNLANSPSLHLLTPEEQTLCSQLRIFPKPYLVIKETLIREYARRGGKLRRREARDLVKIDVNKTSRVWDFLVQAGLMRVGPLVTDPLHSAAHDK